MVFCLLVLLVFNFIQYILITCFPSLNLPRSSPHPHHPTLCPLFLTYKSKQKEQTKTTTTKKITPRDSYTKFPKTQQKYKIGNHNIWTKDKNKICSNTTVLVCVCVCASQLHPTVQYLYTSINSKRSFNSEISLWNTSYHWKWSPLYIRYLTLL